MTDYDGPREGRILEGEAGIDRTPGIQGRFDSLEEAIDTLDKIVDGLTGRLSSVLRNDPRPVDEDCVSQMPHCSPLAQGLIVLKTRCDRVQDRLRDILGRLEL